MSYSIFFLFIWNPETNVLYVTEWKYVRLCKQWRYECDVHTTVNECWPLINLFVKLRCLFLSIVSTLTSLSDPSPVCLSVSPPVYWSVRLSLSLSTWSQSTKNPTSCIRKPWICHLSNILFDSNIKLKCKLSVLKYPFILKHVNKITMLWKLKTRKKLQSWTIKEMQ